MIYQKIILIVFSVGLLVIISCSRQEVSVPKNTTPDKALDHYIHNSDNSFAWRLIEESSIYGVKSYDILLTSQTWQGNPWHHQLTILVPPSVVYNDALLYITGGSLSQGEVKFKSTFDGETTVMALLSLETNALVVIVRQTPNQPLFDGLIEDELISHTLHNYLTDGDLTWPLLFPMVKSAVSAMNATQEFSTQKLGLTIKNFVVAGASKRGWTSWLTGAIDKRVSAIAPMVIDMVNMPLSIPYHLEAWGAYSPQIQDYVKIGLTEELSSGQGGADLVTMIDPYSYRNSLTMPKLILLGTNDPYWPTDAIKHYFYDFPGANFIHNVPNAGHDLDIANNFQSVYALSAFFGNTLNGSQYPACSWDIDEKEHNYELSVFASEDELIDAIFWSSTSPDRDFRDNTWASQSLNPTNKSTIKYIGEYPEEGFKAFYIALIYKDMIGREYSISTRVFVANSSKIL